MKLQHLFVGAITVALLSGCGGGGGSSSAPSSTPAASILSGFGAVGTPIVNGTINVICAAGSEFSSITNSTGAWQFTLTGQTLPCAVQLSGGTINSVANTATYTSIATVVGTVNVTPLTDLLVANLVGSATPRTWFAGLSSPSATLASITQIKVNTALANLSGAVPALTPLGTTSPITTAFTPLAGNISDDMLTALKTAITFNAAGVTYASLLTDASATSFTAPAAGFGTALTAAYTATPSGGGGTTSYTIGGTVSGLTGSVVLQDNGGDNLTVTANGNFLFATQINNVSPYNVTILTQPIGQTCTVSTGAGTVSWNNVTNVAVVCATNTYNVGGSVSGLAGTLVLQDNNGDNLTVTANGTFTFATQVANGSPYSVTVFTHPASQSCSVVSGAGTITAANVTNVAISCVTNTYTVGGTVTGLSGSVVLQNNSGDNLTISTNGFFTFPTAVAYGNTYNVTVFTQPNGQTCSVSTGTGTISLANITNVLVTCALNSYTIGGTVTGLNGSMVLQNSGIDNLTVSTNGSFTFPTTVAYGNTYNVIVLTPPAGQTCAVTGGSGTATATVTSVVVNCTPNSITLFSIPDLLFGGSPTALPLPYAAIAVVSPTVICVGSGCATGYDVGTFELIASGQSYTITNLQATNSTTGSTITPSFSGLANGQIITAGQTVTFDLMSPFTGGNTVNLTYSFTIQETGQTFSYVVQLRTN